MHLVPARLYDIAHAHAGDKGNTCNISVIPYEKSAYKYLLQELTEYRVKVFFSHRKIDKVTRYQLENLRALNFVLKGILEGGVNQSLGLDGHGQSLSFYLLTMELLVPQDLLSHPSTSKNNNLPNNG